MSQLCGHYCSPKTAWDILASEQNSFLIDVRTREEWESDGLPALETINKAVIMIEWRTAPDMSLNRDFAAQLSQAISDKNAQLFFICRSGARSDEAAAFARSAGYPDCTNVSHGFKGRTDSTTPAPSAAPSTWVASDLPWRQL